MKTLVLYYSLEGSTRRIAKIIASSLKADIKELEVLKSINKDGFMKYLWGGRQVVMKQKPKLKDLDVDFADYNLIIIGTPVWAFTYAPALRTFFERYPLKGKKVALFCAHEGGLGKTIDNMKKELTGNNIIAEAGFMNVAKMDDKTLAKELEPFIKNIKL